MLQLRPGTLPAARAGVPDGKEGQRYVLSQTLGRSIPVMEPARGVVDLDHVAELYKTTWIDAPLFGSERKFRGVRECIRDVMGTPTNRVSRADLAALISRSKTAGINGLEFVQYFDALVTAQQQGKMSAKTIAEGVFPDPAVVAGYFP